MTLLDLRRKYGTSPMHDVRFYPSDWMIDEPFFRETELPDPVPGIRLLEETRNMTRLIPLDREPPLAVTVAHHFFNHWERTGEILWPEDYIWCRDRDTNGDQIYVGGYNLGRVPGFQIHRYLTINHHFIAAEEV